MFGLPLPLFAAGAVPPPLVWIDDQDVSGVAEVDITWGDQAFEQVFVLASTIKPSVDNVSFVMRTSSDNGASFDAGAADYRSTNYSGIGYVGGGSAARLQLCPSTSQSTTHTMDQNGQCAFFTTIQQPSDASLKTVVQTIGGYKASTLNNEVMCNQHGYRDVAGRVNGLRYLNNTGTFSGRFQAWGLVR